MFIPKTKYCTFNLQQVYCGYILIQVYIIYFRCCMGSSVKDIVVKCKCNLQLKLFFLRSGSIHLITGPETQLPSSWLYLHVIRYRENTGYIHWHNYSEPMGGHCPLMEKTHNCKPQEIILFAQTTTIFSHLLNWQGMFALRTIMQIMIDKVANFIIRSRCWGL